MADKLDLLLTVCSDALRAEQQAMKGLTGTAEKYLAAIGVILGFHILELGTLSFCGSAARTACSIVALVGLGLLLVALGMALLSMRVREYPTFPKSEDLQRLAEATTEDQAKRAVVKVYLALRDGILAVNEKRASTVRISGVTLALGFLMSVLGQLGLVLKFQ